MPMSTRQIPKGQSTVAICGSDTHSKMVLHQSETFIYLMLLLCCDGLSRFALKLYFLVFHNFSLEGFITLITHKEFLPYCASLTVNCIRVPSDSQFGQPESHLGQVDVNDLLSKLISTGIIKPATTDASQTGESLRE